MPQLLQHNASYWREIGGICTAEEIAQQPAAWRALSNSLNAQGERVAEFLQSWLLDPECRVVLTGAGSSAYVAEIVVESLNASWAAEVRAIASTSLLTHPDLYIDRSRPTLLVSFARSGNSPESQACVDLFRALLEHPRFLNITCNAGGLLATANADRVDTFNLILPSETCDRGFAMTSSFTTMLLAALAVLGDGDLRRRWRSRCCASNAWSCPASGAANSAVSYISAAAPWKAWPGNLPSRCWS
jgi:tagatose-6-phosphate ketose/aldose isomerase